LASIIGAAVSINAKKSANTKEEQMEAADTRLEDTKETVEEHGEMYDSYTELYNTYKKTGEGREELAEQANKLAAAYGIEGAATAALTGNYDDLTRAINAARAAEL
jgi:archaellum component FlaC